MPAGWSGTRGLTPMRRYVVRRLLQAALVMIGVTVITFG